MASDKPQLEILDLLYDDELDEQTRAAARRDVEQSDEARDELEAYETMLAKIRETDLDQDVPESVHDSIMASAREHTAKNASRQARVTRRAPKVSKQAEKNLWSRLNSSGVTQLVLAAAVVLVGGFIFLKLGGNNATEPKFNTAQEAVDKQVTFGDKSASELAQAPSPEVDEKANQMQPAQQESAKQELAKQELAKQELAEQEPTEETAAEEQTEGDRTAKKSKIGELAQLDKRAESQPPQPEAKEQSVRKRRARRSGSRKKDSPNDQMEVFEDASKPAATTKKRRPAPAAAEREEARLDDGIVQTESSSSSRSRSAPSKSGVTDSADLGRSLGAIADSSADEPSSASGAAAPAENKPVPSQDSDQEQTSSVNAMESNYRSGNFAGVVTQADRYLSRSSSDQVDEARVLELKARALARQGKTNEADGVYAELQKKHPSYKSDQIRRERADLTKERESKAKQRRRAPAEANEQMDFDSEDQAVPDSQPSSMDNAY
jgi:hypothetical protein